ncbi:hypothetical protein S7711_03586 [Stachybotrys chartarum IBT 7711]|uniref:Epoxide hydrolase N-terminal domain-containing protein n=1 Tax=Stachybotrys chartarum (strain CBS 109288 / IBT 7711) TaxID=1280523 RepID=A0A084AGU0_STACB|nr:hypothetical protein S7711_03586 [Stachybotrys chartarum IBT 7711]KFA51006.1 hypothetical protein S40293_07265 [Stachybotrys chartarum IBT 40293]
MATRQFKIHVPQEKLDRLHQKLALTEFPGNVSSDDSWDQGPPVAEIQRLAKVWQTTYNWRESEALLNRFPQFISAIDVDGFATYDIHHIHMRSARPDAIPLLFLHGWPGSFIEATRIAKELVQGSPNRPSFHFVAPSLIDFGFSSGSDRIFGIDQHAEAYDKLMQALGYDSYAIQAGDVGCLITRFIARKYASRCKAYHTNTPLPNPPDAELHPELHKRFVSTPLTEQEKTGLARAARLQDQGYGYYKQQSTKPRTLAFGLKDSPVGLLAWLYEKMHDWSDKYPWTDDEILTWISIYYFSRAGPDAANNVYYAMEATKPSAFAQSQAYVDVPFGVARFANDIVSLPKLWNETLGPVVFSSEHQTGGHFAAWERPDAIIADLQAMFAKPDKFGFGV